MAAIELYNTPLFTDPNLVAYWRMEGNSNDSKGSYNGTDTNITYSAGNGKFGQGAGFNGTNSQISVANNSNLAPSSLTVMAWVNATSFPAAYNSVVGYEDGDEGFTILAKSTGKLAMYLSGLASINYDGTGTYTLSTGTYYHVALTYDSGVLTGYVNGQVDKTVSGTWTYTNPEVSPFYIGQSVTASREWSGKLDDVALFSRALSATEIANYYNGAYATSNFFMFM